MIPETNLSPDHFLAQVFEMGQEEHDIILQRVRESKVRVLSDTMHMTLSACTVSSFTSSFDLLFHYRQIIFFLLYEYKLKKSSTSVKYR